MGLTRGFPRHLDRYYIFSQIWTVAVFGAWIGIKLVYNIIMNEKVIEVTVEGRSKCIFCHKSELNSLEWGPLYTLEGLTAHHFCMLFSCGLSQNGNDEEGILGFLPDDILREQKRGKRLRCVYCKRSGTTIGCSNASCQRMFHFPCGAASGCEFQFIGNFESYCPRHKTVDYEDPLVEDEDTCPICFEQFGEVKTGLLTPPCCNRQSLHKTCIMKNARSQGALFKCPLCRDINTFTVAMRKSGIYVPDRDATWELEPGAYAEQMEYYSKCDAETCLCSRGREFQLKHDTNPWKIVRCGACAASAVHRRCGSLKTLTWRCPTCADILSAKQRKEKLRCESSDDERSEAINEHDKQDSPLAMAMTGTAIPTTSRGNFPCETKAKTVKKPVIVFDERLRRYVVDDNSSDSDDNSSDSEEEFDTPDNDHRCASDNEYIPVAVNLPFNKIRVENSTNEHSEQVQRGSSPAEHPASGSTPRTYDDAHLDVLKSKPVKRSHISMAQTAKIWRLYERRSQEEMELRAQMESERLTCTLERQIFPSGITTNLPKPRGRPMGRPKGKTKQKGRGRGSKRLSPRLLDKQCLERPETRSQRRSQRRKVQGKNDHNAA